MAHTGKDIPRGRKTMELSLQKNIHRMVDFPAGKLT